MTGMAVKASSRVARKKAVSCLVSMDSQMCASGGRRADARIIGERSSIYKVNFQPKVDIKIRCNEGRTPRQSIRVLVEREVCNVNEYSDS